MTFKQAEDHGAHVRKGEHGTHVVFTKPLVFKGEDDEIEKRSMLREYTVFNVAQIEDFTATETLLPPEPERHAAVEVFIAATNARIRHGGDKACFIPAIDLVNLPPASSFRSIEAPTRRRGTRQGRAVSALRGLLIDGVSQVVHGPVEAELAAGGADQFDRRAQGIKRRIFQHVGVVEIQDALIGVFHQQRIKNRRGVALIAAEHVALLDVVGMPASRERLATECGMTNQVERIEIRAHVSLACSISKALKCALCISASGAVSTLSPGSIRSSIRVLASDAAADAEIIGSHVARVDASTPKGLRL
jgi:hypothetical protein